MIIEEIGSSLTFEFDDSAWTYLMKYDSDAQNKQVDYDKIKNAIEGTKAVDFIGIFQNNQLNLIEVKNYKFNPLDANHDIIAEIAQKVRDTMAGIIGGSRHSTHQKEYWHHHLQYLTNPAKDVRITLWLEDDKPLDKRLKTRNSNYLTTLKKKLSWLTSNVKISNIADNDFGDALKVSNLPRTK